MERSDIIKFFKLIVKSILKILQGLVEKKFSTDWLIVKSLKITYKFERKRFDEVTKFIKLLESLFIEQKLTIL